MWFWRYLKKKNTVSDGLPSLLVTLFDPTFSCGLHAVTVIICSFYPRLYKVLTGTQDKAWHPRKKEISRCTIFCGYPEWLTKLSEHTRKKVTNLSIIFLTVYLWAFHLILEKLLIKSDTSFQTYQYMIGSYANKSFYEFWIRKRLVSNCRNSLPWYVLSQKIGIDKVWVGQIK